MQLATRNKSHINFSLQKWSKQRYGESANENVREEVKSQIRSECSCCCCIGATFHFDCVCIRIAKKQIYHNSPLTTCILCSSINVFFFLFKPIVPWVHMATTFMSITCSDIVPVSYVTFSLSLSHSLPFLTLSQPFSVVGYFLVWLFFLFFFYTFQSSFENAPLWLYGDLLHIG